MLYPHLDTGVKFIHYNKVYIFKISFISVLYFTVQLIIHFALLIIDRDAVDVNIGESHALN